MGGIGPPGPPWGGGNGGKGMPRPGIGAVFSGLGVSIGKPGRVKGGEGIYEGEIRGDHPVGGRLECRKEVGGDLNMEKDQELALFF